MTLADLRRNLERQMIVSQVQQNEVSGKIAVSDEESRRYYDAHSTEFTTPQTITLREDLRGNAGDGKALNVGADEAARDKATTIRERAMTGESFEKLAAEMSDSPSKANAGLIGPLSLDGLCAGAAQADRSDEGRRRQRAAPRRRGYQILKLESTTPVTIAAVRAGAGADQRARLHRQAAGGVREVSRAAARRRRSSSGRTRTSRRRTTRAWRRQSRRPPTPPAP